MFQLSKPCNPSHTPTCRCEDVARCKRMFMGLQGRLWQLWSGDNGGTRQGWSSVVLMVPEIESRRALSCQKHLCVSSSSSSTVQRQMAQGKRKGPKGRFRMTWAEKDFSRQVHVMSSSGFTFNFYWYSLVGYVFFDTHLKMKKLSCLNSVKYVNHHPLNLFFP